MEIRPATVDDIEGVLPMVARLCALHEQWDPVRYCHRPQPEQRYRNWLAARCDDPRSVFLVADSGDAADAARLKGMLIGTTEREIGIYTTGDYGYIHDLWVEDDYRNEGVGRQLVMLAIERFATMGIRQIRLATAWSNETARRLFEACGFRPATVEMLLEVDLPDEGGP